MVDQERRKKLALHLRHLSIGLISNREFEGNIIDDITSGSLPEYYRFKQSKSDDAAIAPMLEMCWQYTVITKTTSLKENTNYRKKILSNCKVYTVSSF